MIKAIVYTSCTGHTEEYANLLSQETGLPVYRLKEAEKDLQKGTEIIYLGWLMAGVAKGFESARKSFDVKALCGVGMSGSNTQLDDIKKANKVPENLPVFYLQGGFEMDKLHGIYKLMMKTMKSTVGKKLSDKPDRTPEESEMLELLVHGGNCVSREKLYGVIHWLAQNRKA